MPSIPIAKLYVSYFIISQIFVCFTFPYTFSIPSIIFRVKHERIKILISIFLGYNSPSQFCFCEEDYSFS
jgi:hypothetical protein